MPVGYELNLNFLPLISYFLIEKRRKNSTFHVPLLRASLLQRYATKYVPARTINLSEDLTGKNISNMRILFFKINHM